MAWADIWYKCQWGSKWFGGRCGANISGVQRGLEEGAYQLAPPPAKPELPTAQVKTLLLPRVAHAASPVAHELCEVCDAHKLAQGMHRARESRLLRANEAITKHGHPHSDEGRALPLTARLVDACDAIGRYRHSRGGQLVRGIAFDLVDLQGEQKGPSLGHTWHMRRGPSVAGLRGHHPIKPRARGEDRLLATHPHLRPDGAIGPTIELGRSAMRAMPQLSWGPIHFRLLSSLQPGGTSPAPGVTRPLGRWRVGAGPDWTCRCRHLDRCPHFLNSRGEERSGRRDIIIFVHG